MRICAVTGARAEFGIRYWVLKKIEQDPAFELRLVATRAHRSPEFGSRFREIEAYARHQPDMVLMLGDRHELLAAWRPMRRLPMYQGCPRMQAPVAEDVQAHLINMPSGPAIATAATREQRRL
jgi:UDP-N-acetylglucosamine 2-epimerase